MKMMKKSVSVLLALMLLLSTFLCLPFSALASTTNDTYKKDGYYYSYHISNKKVIVDEAYAVDEEKPTATMNIPSKIKGYPVTTVKGIGAYNAKTIVFPDSVINIGSTDYGYLWAYSVKTIKIGKGVKFIADGMFSYLNTLKSFTVNADNSYFSSKGGVLYNKKQTVLISYPAAKTVTSFTTPTTVKTVASGAFGGYAESADSFALKTLTLSDSVTTLQPNAIQGTAIATINIGKGLRYYQGDAIAEAPYLKTITVAKNNAYFASWKNVLYSKDYTKLYKYPAAKSGTSYTVWREVTAIGDGAFAYSKLKSVTLPSGLKTIGNGAFCESYDLAKATVPATVKSIGNWGFQATALKSVALPKSVTALGYGAYQFCHDLTTADLSKTKLKSIKRDTFSCNNALTSVKLPSTLTTIGTNSFYYNPSLKSITIPASVTKIGAYAFYDNDALKTMTIKGKQVSIHSYALPRIYNEKTGKYVYKLTLKAPKGSTAETFANKHNIKFVALS